MIVRTASGDYRKFTGLILKYSIKLINFNRFIKSCSILELLEKVLQNWKYIISDEVFNTKVRAELLIKQNNGHSIDMFQWNEVVALDFLRGLAYVTEDIIDIF